MRILFILIFCQWLVACSVNPVTGKPQLSLVSEQEEIALGAENYRAYQQSEGGRYVVDPELSVYVSSIGQALAQVSDRQLPYEFVVLNNDVPNAWALPGGKIAINRGLLVLLEDEAQLAAVLGHEIVHAAAGHGASQQSKGKLLNIGMEIMKQTKASDYTSLVGFGAGALLAKYGRDQELESDEYGIKYMQQLGYDPMAAVELQQLFLQLSQGRQSDLLSDLFSSHPPSAERVDKNRQLAIQLGATGMRNKKRFQQAIAQLVKDKAAYDLHQQANKAASQKQMGQALKLVNQAISKQPKESLFWLTKGRIEAQIGTRTQALKAFDQSISLNPDYYLPYLYRGMFNLSAQQTADATRDFLASTDRLQTSIADYYLGEIAYSQNDRETAKAYFYRASQGQGEYADAARARLSRL